MLRAFPIAIALLLICGGAFAQDGFEAVKCTSNIGDALVGRHLRNERAVVTERRNQNIGLKDLGGTEVSDALFLESWLICGSEYELLINRRNDLILDVLAFPVHSKIAPEFIGSCQANGRQIEDEVIAVLDNASEYKAKDPSRDDTLLAVKAAWRIDEKTRRFVSVPIDGLRCPSAGIVTSDGGW